MKNKKAKLRAKADKAFQEWGRNHYSSCFVCGGEYSCLHHYIPKSLSARLRYDKRNVIPLCGKCHFAHHTRNDPYIHSYWEKCVEARYLDKLEALRREPVKLTVKYYEEIIKKYEK